MISQIKIYDEQKLRLKQFILFHFECEHIQMTKILRHIRWNFFNSFFVYILCLCFILSFYFPKIEHRITFHTPTGLILFSRTLFLNSLAIRCFCEHIIQFRAQALIFQQNCYFSIQSFGI